MYRSMDNAKVKLKEIKMKMLLQKWFHTIMSTGIFEYIEFHSICPTSWEKKIERPLYVLIMWEFRIYVLTSFLIRLHVNYTGIATIYFDLRLLINWVSFDS